MSIEINGAGTITGVDSLSTPAVTNAAGSASAPSITFTGDTNTGLYSPGADQVAVTTGGTARLFVDASGRLLVGTSTSRAGWFNTSGQDSLIQAETTTQNVFSGVQNSNSALGPWILLGKSRGTTAGAVTVVQNNDPLGGITFQGADGTEMVDGCRIQAFVDGTPGANDLPTRLVFSTTADGASSPTERMRIDSSGRLLVGTSSASGNTLLQVNSDAIINGLTVGKGTSGLANNTAFGNQALNLITTGDSNTGIGNAALGACTSGLGNVAVGSSCAQSLDSGANNVCVGRGAGLILTSGGENTLIGRSAGENGGPTTGSRNVLIGLDSRTSAGSGSGQLVINSGSTAIGKGDNTGFIQPNGGGVYQGNNSSSWSTTSDRRLKKNIVDNTEGLDIINQVRVVNFEYRLPEEIEQDDLKSQALVTRSETNEIVGLQGVKLGVIAQELQQVCSDCVKQESTGVLSVVDDNLFWHLINAVKELSAQNAALEERLATLEAQ